MNDTYKIRICDLFAGIGGFHLAFHNLGAKCIFAAEIDKNARKTYEANFKDIEPELFRYNKFADDITKTPPQMLPNFDILCAGFPCQPFSQRGKKQGFEDDNNRGNLFFHILNIIKMKRPKAFFLENVRHLLKHEGGRTFKIIKCLLENQGYSFHYKIVKGTDHNVPQLRPRVFMVGFRGEKNEESSFKFPDAEPLTVTMDDILGGQCNRKVGFTMLTCYGGADITSKYNWANYIVDGKPHKIKPQECKKLMGFPDDFTIPMSTRYAIKQLGNAVVVPAVQATSNSIIEYLHKNHF